MAEYTQEFNTIIGILTEIKDIHADFLARASNPSEGIYINQVCSTCDDERALLMAALKRNGDLDAVVEEKNNPSPPHDLFQS